MIGERVEMPFLTRNDTIPYYFSEQEITRFFSVIHNLKHLCMFQTLFRASLRASELCNLDDSDLDLETLTIRVREGKGGRCGFAFITDDCARYIKQYLEIRPPLIIDGRQPLFFTDFGNRWNRGGLYRIFAYYKVKAGIEKKGGKDS